LGYLQIPVEILWNLDNYANDNYYRLNFKGRDQEIGDADESDMHTMHAFDLGQLSRPSERLECPQHLFVESR